jgi:hypothetical protein
MITSKFEMRVHIDNALRPKKEQFSTVPPKPKER